MQSALTDVFKDCKTLEHQNIEYKGLAKVVLEKELGSRKVLCVQGMVSAENYAKISKQEGLGLGCQYAYFLCKPLGRLFGMQFGGHASGKPFRVSFSSVYKSVKRNGLQVQVPVACKSEWGFLVFDLRHFLGVEGKITLDEIVINASIKVRGVWTSLGFYSLATFPKEIANPPRTGLLYEYAIVGNSIDPDKSKPSQEPPLPSELKENGPLQSNSSQKYAVSEIVAEQSQSQVVEKRKANKKFMQARGASSTTPKDVLLEFKQFKEQSDFLSVAPKSSVLSIRPTTIFQLGVRLIAINGKVASLATVPTTLAIGKNLLSGRRITSFVRNIQSLVRHGSKTLVVHEQGEFTILVGDQHQGYFSTGLERVVSCDFLGDRVFAVAADSTRRLHFLVVQKDQLVFRKSLTYEVHVLSVVGGTAVGAGRECILTWREVTSKTRGETSFKQRAVPLGELARDSVFTDIRKFRNTALVSSSRGILVILDYQAGQVLSALKLHQSGITCLQVLQESVLTASEAKEVKLWGNDFSQVEAELKLEHSIRKMCAGNVGEVYFLQADCGVGLLSLSERKYSLQARSHAERVLSGGLNQQGKFISIAEDYCIKVWALQKRQRYDLVQQHQFRILDELCSCLSVSLARPQFVVGFEGGTLRLFNSSSHVLQEEAQLEGESIASVDYSADGKLIIVLTKSGQRHLFNSNLQHLEALDGRYQFVVFCGNSVLAAVKEKEVQLWATLPTNQLYSLQLEHTPKKIKSKGSNLFILNDKYVVAQYSIRISKLDAQLHFTRQLKVGVCRGFEVCGTRIVTFGEELLVENGLSMKRLWSLGTLAGVAANWQERVLIGWSDDQSCQIFAFDVQGELDESPECLPESCDQARPAPITIALEAKSTLSKEQTEARPAQQSSKVQDLVFRDIADYQPLPVEFPAFFKTKQLPQNQPVKLSKAVESEPQQFAIDKLDQPLFERSSLMKLQRVIGIRLGGRLRRFPWDKPSYLLNCGQSLLSTSVGDNPEQSLLPFSPDLMRVRSEHSLLLSGNTVHFLSRSRALIHQLEWPESLNSGVYQFFTSPCLNFVVLMGKHLTVLDKYGKFIGRGAPGIDGDWCSGLEFLVLYPKQLLFYRITQSRLLEYQEAVLPTSQQMTSCKYLSLLGEELVLVGTVKGSVLVVSCRTGSLLAALQSIAKCQITSIVETEGFVWLLTKSTEVLYFRTSAPNLVDLFEHPGTLLLDGLPAMVSQNAHKDCELLVLSSTGVVWCLCPDEHLTLKLVTHGKQPVTCAIQVCDGSQDVLVYGQGNFIRIVSPSLQLKGEMFCPKSRVNCVSHLQNIQVVCTGHEDGALRIILLENYVLVGSASFGLPVRAMRSLPGTRNLLVATGNHLRSEVWMCFVQQEKEFCLQIQKIIQAQGECYGIELDPNAPLSRLAWWGSGWLQVWERKDLLKKDPLLQLKKVHQLEYYLIDSYKASQKPCVLFSDGHTIVIADGPALVYRAYAQHFNVRRVELFSSVRSMFQLGRTLMIEGEDGMTRLLDKDSGIEKCGWLEKGAVSLSRRGVFRLGACLRLYRLNA